VAWYQNVENWLTIAGGVITGAVGWVIGVRKNWSKSNTQVAQDNTERAWYNDMMQRIKDAEAGEAAAIATSHSLLKAQTEDARVIARLETLNDGLKERAATCERAAAKAEARATEEAERSRSLSEQLLYTHLRGREMFSVISRLDPMEAAQVVKKHMDANIQDVKETIEAHDSKFGELK
jgi:hypothetical protein